MVLPLREHWLLTRGDCLDAIEVQARLDRAWTEVRGFWDRVKNGEVTRDQDPQPKLAAEFFEYFLQNRDSDLGRRALTTACMMLGNGPNADMFERILPELDFSADYWEPVLHGVANAYHRSGRADAVVPLLHRYASLLTHARSQSSVFLSLARHYLRRSDTALARSFFERIVGLAAAAGHVGEAEGGLYELVKLTLGSPAPQFEARTIDGQVMRLADLQGRVVCLDFWDTGCGPCWREFPILRTINSEFAGSAFQLIGISSDEHEVTLRAVLAAERLDWPQIRQEVRWDGSRAILGPLRTLFNVWGVPRTFLIDRDGRIVAKDLRGEQLATAVRNHVMGEP